MHAPTLPQRSARLSLPAMAVVVALLQGCSSAPPRAMGELDAPSPRSIASRLSPTQAADVTLNAVALVGTPYRRGGNTPDSGFDCSGLIHYVYKSSAGVSSPRTVAQLSDWGQPVPSEAVQTGDLVVFTLGSGPASHAGIYVGDGRFVHAPSTGGEVRLDRLASVYWSRQQVAFRRP